MEPLQRTLPLHLKFIHGSVPFPRLIEHRSDASQLQLHEIACGLAYLHEERVVHGDLRGVGTSFFNHSHP